MQIQELTTKVWYTNAAWAKKKCLNCHLIHPPAPNTPIKDMLQKLSLPAQHLMSICM
jgi:hypothetical protein